MSKCNSLIFYTISLILLLSGCNLSPSSNSTETNKKSDALFNFIPADQSNLNFTNNIFEGPSDNILLYDYMYNGGGVAIADINNDGLQDVFFTGNMVDNKLFLNKGNLKFEDITVKAGVGAPNSWCTGIAVVDINTDGYLDFYVCKAYKTPLPEQRANLLFINNQDLTFSEKAEQYGLADTHHSTQATFFDYDLDGDLDMYLNNYPPDFWMDSDSRYETWLSPKKEMSNLLFKNNGDQTFQEVTEASNLIDFGWSLGVVASDLNLDGLPDLYVANDYSEPDRYYVNQGDGTFKDELKKQIGHTSQFGMGVDVADVNNDGFPEILVADMVAEDNFRNKVQMAGMNPAQFWSAVEMGFHYQYMRNTLQLNNGNESFSEIGQMAGIAHTDWSWAVLFADFDNNSNKDIYISNGFRRDSRNKDFRRSLDEQFKQAGGQFSAEQMQAIIEKIPVNKITNYLFMNEGNLSFSKAPPESGINTPSFSNGTAFGDLDNDGDLEIVVNNLTDPAFLYQNLSNEKGQNNYLRVQLRGSKENPLGLGTKVTLSHNGEIQYQEFTLTRGYQSSVEPFIHFGLGNSSESASIKVVWPDGNEQSIDNIKVNQVLAVEHSRAKPGQQTDVPKLDPLFKVVEGQSEIFVHSENEYDDYLKEILLPHKTSQFGPGLAVADVNNDGEEDFYVGGASGQSGELFLRDGIEFKKINGGPWEKDSGSEDLGSLFFDSDSDGDLDLYVVSGGNEFEENSDKLQDRLYINDGKGNFTNATSRLPELRSSGACVKNHDFDADGDEDLFIGGRLVPGKYPFPPKSFLLENENGVFKDVTAERAPDLANIGMVTDAVWADFDGDDKSDLIIVGEWMPISFFKYSDGVFKNKTSESGLENTSGWWFSLSVADYDSDGDLDLVCGNLGRNYKYKASVAEPFHVYCGDFDGSGSNDIVLGYFNEGIVYPVRGKQCSSEQMPGISKLYPTYEAFGKATLQDIYNVGLESALHYEAQTFESVYLENLGGGRFKSVSLPVEAQIAPINSIISEDIDSDGNIDLLIAGNLFVSEVETGRADAGIGLMLKGNGHGKFVPVHVNKSGFFAPGDVKTIKYAKSQRSSSLILVASNDSPMKIFKLNSDQKTLGLK